MKHFAYSSERNAKLHQGFAKLHIGWSSWLKLRYLLNEKRKLNSVKSFEFSIKFGVWIWVICPYLTKIYGTKIWLICANLGKKWSNARKNFTALRFSYSFKQTLFSKIRINLQQSLATRFLFPILFHASNMILLIFCHTGIYN